MYESLKKYSGNFHLYIFAFDDVTYKYLIGLDLKLVTVVSLKEFEDTELLSVKPHRTKAEYCWTCTPSVIYHVLSKFAETNCTYVDSDLVFYSDPNSLIKEMIDKNKSVLITEHRFSPIARLYEKKRAGKFCVQFMTFLNSIESLKVLDRWRSQCINWCYSRYEDGKFGDQKYLDEWPEIYENIHILQNHGGGIAPWNIQKYRFIKDNITIKGVEKSSGIIFNTVFFHFQYVKNLERGLFDIGWYHINSNVRKLFYIPYLQKIDEIENNIVKDSEYNRNFTTPRNNGIKDLIKNKFKEYFKYNIIRIKT
jgi:hypothetical protein